MIIDPLFSISAFNFILERTGNIWYCCFSPYWNGGTKYWRPAWSANKTLSLTAMPWHSSLNAENRGEDRYLSPKLGKTTTIVFPADSGLTAILLAAVTAAPDEMPQKMPSSFANRFAMCIDSSLLICNRKQCDLRSPWIFWSLSTISWCLMSNWISGDGLIRTYLGSTQYWGQECGDHGLSVVIQLCHISNQQNLYSELQIYIWSWIWHLNLCATDGVMSLSRGRDSQNSMRSKNNFLRVWYCCNGR